MIRLEFLEPRVGHGLDQLCARGIEPDIIGVPTFGVDGVKPSREGDERRLGGKQLGGKAPDVLRGRQLAGERDRDIKRRGPDARTVSVREQSL